MSCILNIETSTSVCSVAASQDGQTIFVKEDLKGPSHAVSLGVFVDEMCIRDRGNNDYERCHDEIVNTMKHYGMRPLEHEVDTLRKDGQQIIIAGVRNPCLLYTSRCV